MGLSACMWTSVSGLLSHGQKMNVVGNNLANVSTIGFKAQRMDFEDYLYVNKGTASGTKQIGQGSSVYTILGDFSQGAFESTNSVTDIAIDGNGFFKVRKPNSENMFYSRAGDFYFNADRELQNPEGYLLQGWKVNNEKRIAFNGGSTNLGTGMKSESPYVGTGSPVDIVLDSWNIIPQRTTNVTFTMGLVNDVSSDRTTSTSSPLTALFDQWDGAAEPPMPDTAYATQSSIKVYDEGGTTHELTVYYDQVSPSKTDSNGNVIYEIEGLPAGYTVYEYLVTMSPSEDKRSYGGTYDPATDKLSGETKFYNPTGTTSKNAGMLMTGLMIFDASGQLVNQTAYTYGATENPAPNHQVDVDPDLKSSWQPTKISNNGLPVFSANFTGQPLANSVSETRQKGDATESQVQNYITELDFGLRDLDSVAWTNLTAPALTTKNGKPVNAADRVQTDGSTIPADATLTMDKYGYRVDDAAYPAVNGSYGSDSYSVYDPGSGAAITKDRLVYADNVGYYYLQNTGTTDEQANRVYGTSRIDTISDTDDVEVYSDGKSYYFIDTSNPVDAGRKCYNTSDVTEYTLASPPNQKAYSNVNGYYYLDTGGEVYGDTYYSGGTATPGSVRHDANGFYFTNSSSENVYGWYSGNEVKHDTNGYYYKPGTDKIYGEYGSNPVKINTSFSDNWYYYEVTPETGDSWDDGKRYGTITVSGSNYDVKRNASGGFYYYDPVGYPSQPQRTISEPNQMITKFSFDKVDTLPGYTSLQFIPISVTSKETDHPAYKDSFGSFYYNDNVNASNPQVTDKIYGIYQSSPTASPTNVYHDSSIGFFIFNSKGEMQALSAGEFDKVVAPDLRPDHYVLPKESTRPEGQTEMQRNNLSCLSAVSTANGITPEGVPIYKNVIDFSSVAPTMTAVERQEYASAANATSPTVQDSSQDGYGSGVLSNIDIDTAGVVSGLYSNGKTLPLYQIALYDFKCEQGLYREGGNLFSATRESGEPKQGVPGDNGFGATRAYNIEQSNVDMSTEFVQMISTQRGFQANSKSVTTVDTMLETVIGMKR